MNNWGEDIFAQLAVGYVMNRYCAVNALAQQSWSKSPRTAEPTPAAAGSD
jgi:hypothetical protein